jgi:prepilin-type N-terminal cleavage/methylation domain-containing protein
MHPKIKGFTLLELSIVVMVLSLMAASILSILTQQTRIKKQAELAQKMDRIELALQNYVKNAGRLPCPASATFPPGNNAFGFILGDLGVCDGNTNLTGNVFVGAVPVRSIGIPDEYMFDPWGGRIMYAVDIRATDQLSLSVTYSLRSNAIGAITVKDDNAGNNRITDALVVLLSHGPNGHGAYQLSGARKSSDSSNVNELKNCHCTNATPPVDGILDTTFVMQNATQAGGNLLNSFDDTVRYYHRGYFMRASDEDTEIP